MKKYVLSYLFLIISATLHAQYDPTDLEKMKSDFERNAQQTVEDFETYAEQARKDYEAYSKTAREEYLQYAERVQQVWGGDSIVESTKHTWVEYGKNLEDRSVVDFENGNIDLEVVLDESADSTEIYQRLVDALERLLESRGSTCPYPSTVDASDPIAQQPILNGLVDYSGYDLSKLGEGDGAPAPVSKRRTPPRPVVKGKDLDLKPREQAKVRQDVVKPKPQRKNIADRRMDNQKKVEEILKRRQALEEKRELAKLIIQQSKKESVRVPAPPKRPTKPQTRPQTKPQTKPQPQSGGKKTVKIQMKLVANNISKNAALYKDLVKECSARFQIEEPLIYAIMEQESSFNPEAQSWVPAYGLMQLVPTSGGLDAYRYVYKKDWAPSRSFLFVPKNNIELGTAYLRILSNQFSRVSNPECRRLCVIASYNTGAGNVSRAFTGNTRLGNALPEIDKYDYNRLYNHLTTRLNTEEARNYVKGVSKRREKYL